MTHLDDEYLMSFSNDQQRIASNRDDKCPYCGPNHAWHGLACRAQGATLPCSCATSFRAAA